VRIEALEEGHADLRMFRFLVLPWTDFLIQRPRSPSSQAIFGGSGRAVPFRRYPNQPCLGLDGLVVARSTPAPLPPLRQKENCGAPLPEA
jgi:hypothetical protein